MAGRLRSVKNTENEILKIAGVAVLGVVGIYALVRSAPALGDLFTKGISNIVSGIEAGFPNFSNILGGGSTSNQPPLPGTVGSNLGGSTGISSGNVQEAIKQAGLPPAPSGTETFIAGGAVAETNTPGILDQAISILLGKTNPKNLATNPDLKAAENSLISQLSQSAATELTGQKPVGLFKVPGGDVVPLTQNAVDYYNQIHVGITEVVHY